MAGLDTFTTETIAFLPTLFETLFAVIAAASAITALTPTPADDRIVGSVYRFVEMLALNVGYAKDKPAKGGRFVPR